MVRKIAITGNIASGKSEVQKIIENKGFKVLDADAAAHEILKNSEEIPRIFKDYDVFENGKISRKKLGRLVFANENLRRKLEAVIHPQVREKIKDFFAANKTEKVVFAAIPLLFEANMRNMFDKVVLVYADDEIRLERLLKRSGCTREHALTRMASQMPQDEKIKLSDFVIYNNGTLEDLRVPSELFS
ncbi:MAG: dephospho-CoA kinase [Heliobacteriaceae bacterium]|jgi:dephospho-CoA kinase|nr:dephospho-CoA kinase [Heliobacteriaceae bacterium]